MKLKDRQEDIPRVDEGLRETELWGRCAMDLPRNQEDNCM